MAGYILCPATIGILGQSGGSILGVNQHQEPREGLAAAKANGKLLGCPNESLGRSKLEGRELEIQILLAKGVSNASIAKIIDVSRINLLYFIRTRQLDNGSRADVEFVARAEYLGDDAKCMWPQITLEDTEQMGRATLLLFDDGWRVEEAKVKGANVPWVAIQPER